MKWCFEGETTEYDSEMVCANCGKEIEAGDEYYRCLDNYLIVKYFDDDSCNVFCSQGCFCQFLSLTEFYNGNTEDEIEDFEDEGEKE